MPRSHIHRLWIRRPYKLKFLRYLCKSHGDPKGAVAILRDPWFFFSSYGASGAFSAELKVANVFLMS